jgi:hypothetical protein
MVNVNNVIESMQSKGIKFMTPLKISSEERAGEEWNYLMCYRLDHGNTKLRHGWSL